MKRNPARLHWHRPDLSEMFGWDDVDLQQVEQLRREYQASGLSKSEASQRAAITVRRARQTRRNQW